MVLLLFSKHILLPILMWMLTLYHGKSWSWCGISFLASPRQLSSFRVNQRQICWHHDIPINVIFITLWKLHYFYKFGGWMHSTIPASFRWVQSKCLAEHVTSLSHSSGPFLGGGSLASYTSQHVGRFSSLVSHHKRTFFSRPGAKGSAMAAFNPFAAQWCVAQTRIPFLGLSGSGRGNSSIYSAGLWALLEWIGWIGVLERIYKNANICP